MNMNIDNIIKNLIYSSPLENKDLLCYFTISHFDSNGNENIVLNLYTNIPEEVKYTTAKEEDLANEIWSQIYNYLGVSVFLNILRKSPNKECDEY